MTGQTSASEENHPPVKLRDLFRRIVRSAVENKGLALGVFASAFLAAFFTKGPFLLLKPFTEALVPTPKPDTDTFGYNFLLSFNEFAAEVIAFLGIEITGGNAEQKGIVLVCVMLSALSAICGGFAIYYAITLSRTFAAKVVVDLRNEVAAHILQLPLGFFGRRRMGDLLSNMTNNTAVLARSFTLAADHAILDPLHICINICVLGVAAPQLLWIFIPALPLLALPIIRLGRRIHKRSGRTMEAMGDTTESLNQMLSGIKTVKAFQLEAPRFQEFRDNNQTFFERTKSMLQAKGRSQGLVFVIYQTVFAAMLLTFGWIFLGENLSLGSMAVAGAAMSTSYTHVKRLSRVYNTMMESLGAMEAVDGLLREKPDIANQKQGVELNGLSGEMRMEGVHFAYGDEPVLSGIDFVAEKGAMVALVGPSGGGKSTTIDLLARFYDPIEGRVLIDGLDLKDVRIDSYRQRMALVSQNPFLFNTSIRQNILYGRPGASQSEVEAAAKAAQIHDFILGLPQQYDTPVGERGSNLSGGQMQRVTIARAILRDPAILFLDEATSALDSESEEAVQKALANLMRGRTSFVIAHRLSTIREADLILVMDKGQIVQRGRHEELIEADGLYRRLIELQNLG